MISTNLNNSFINDLGMERKVRNFMLKNDAKNLRELGEKTKISYEILKNWSCGRTAFGSVNKYKKVKMPKKLNSNIAELVGIILGDGSLDKSQLRIFGNVEEIEYYTKFIQQLIYSIFKVKTKISYRKETKAIVINVSSVLITDYLVSLELKRGNKIKNKVKIPKWILDNKNYLESCIRGLFDTDGSFFSSSKNTEINILWNMGIGSILPNEIRKALIILGYSPTRIFDKGRKIALCKKSEVIRFFKEIKPRNNVQNNRFLKFFNEGSNTARDPNKRYMGKTI
jgi:hypothetical protein